MMRTFLHKPSETFAEKFLIVFMEPSDLNMQIEFSLL